MVIVGGQSFRPLPSCPETYIREPLPRGQRITSDSCLPLQAKLVVRSDDYLHGMDGTITELREQISRLEAERASLLGAVGAEIDSACLALSRESEEKLKVGPVPHSGFGQALERLYPRLPAVFV